MPAKYRYPGKSDFEGATKQGTVSDVDASKLHREKMDSRIVGTTGNAKPFVSAVAYPSTKGSIHTTMKIAEKTINQGDMG